MIKNVLDYMYNSKEKYPLKTAVADDKSAMTYTELVDNATTIAAGLLKYVGVRKAVPVYMDKSCITLAAFMGIVMTDNFYVLLEPGHPAERMKRRLQNWNLRVQLYILRSFLKHRLLRTI